MIDFECNGGGGGYKNTWSTMFLVSTNNQQPPICLTIQADKAVENSSKRAELAKPWYHI